MRAKAKIRDHTVDFRFFDFLNFSFPALVSSDVTDGEAPDVAKIIRNLAKTQNGPVRRSDAESVELFESCIGLAKKLVYDSARKMEWRVHRIDDVEQDALAALAKAAQQYNPELGKFSTWAYSFIDTAIHGLRRKEIKAQQREVGSLNEERFDEDGGEWMDSKTYEDTGVNPFLSPEELMEFSDRRELLLEALEELEPRKRDLMQRWLAEQPNKEIAEEFGVSPSRISQLIQATFQELRASISEKMNEGMAVYGM